MFSLCYMLSITLHLQLAHVGDSRCTSSFTKMFDHIADYSCPSLCLERFLARLDDLF